ncbi:MAG: hypothetical protein FJZ15_01090 [Candidatus Omnitrophica bacterium]|nr:hypothetical protein [Candidatus Omnitrophota bacterium]
MGHPQLTKIAVISLMCFALLGCDNLSKMFNPKKKETAQQVSGVVVAKVANKPLTLEAFNREVDTFNAAIEAAIEANPDLTLEQKREQKKKNAINTPERKLEYLNTVVIRRMVFAQAAIDKGLERRQDIKDALEISRESILAEEMQDQITKNIDISQSELEAAYKSVKDQLKQPEERKLREIVVKTEAEAKQILMELLQGAEFPVLAKERSIAASSKNSGDLGFVTKGQKGGAFDDSVFSPGLQQGSISSIFKGPDGYYLVKIEAIKEGKQLTLADVQDQLKERLLGLKTQDELDKFYNQVSKDNIRIEIQESLIK